MLPSIESIKQQRLKIGMTQKDLANLVGVSTSMINQITTLIQTKEMAVMSTQLSNDKGDDRIDKLYEIAKMNNSMKTTKRKVTVEQLQHMIDSANDDFVEIEI